MEALGQLGQFFSSGSGAGLKDLATIGSAGAGLFGNIAAERQRSQELTNLKQQQAAAEVTPAQLSSEVTSATQPLDRALVSSVGNQVSGTLAEQGLSQAPGIQAQALAAGLAPFEQQNQATALQLVMKRLGIPVEYAQTLLAGNPGQVDLSKLLALLGQKSSGGGLDIAALQKLLNQNNPNSAPATPAQLPWIANLPPVTQATAPNLGLPDWLTNLPTPPPISPVDTGPFPAYGG
jgi:hypothetical protein